MTEPKQDISQMYPVISRILASTGAEVKMGGLVAEDQIYTHSEQTAFTWNYGTTKPGLRRLYGLGKELQWKAEDLPWDTDVDLEKDMFEPDPGWVDAAWFKKLSKTEKNRLVVEYNTNVVSNFVHGEQGALIASSQLISAVPCTDAKFYAATQAMDEARHVEVFSRYLNEKMGGGYEVTQNLFNLLQAITIESRWDFKFLGMQLIVEGLALTAFMHLARRCKEPLLKYLIRMVLQDESRHVAYGVLALKDFYTDMNEQDRKERQEFIYEATMIMRSRLFSGKIFERMGLDRNLVSDSMRDSSESKNFTNLLYANVVPNMKKIGLLDGFLAQKFAEMDILKFQDVDTEGIITQFIAQEDAWRAKQATKASA
jgi:hypothetical protein